MIEVFFDGACAPVNPGGTASYGFVIKKDGRTIESGYGIIGKGEGMTNNVGEYTGIIESIRALSKLDINGKIHIYGDSSMVCKMVAKEWGFKNNKWNPHSKFPHLRKLLDEAFVLLEKYEYTIKWIPREQNAEADSLSKKPLLDMGIIDPRV